MKKPTHEQMMKRPSLWYCEWLDMLKIVYPDIYTQETFDGLNSDWTDCVSNSTTVIRSHYDFLGWL